MSAASSSPASPLANELTITFPKFAKAKGLLAAPFRVQGHAFEMHVFTGVTDPTAAATTPSSTALLAKSIAGSVGCHLVNTSSVPVELRIRITGGGRAPSWAVLEGEKRVVLPYGRAGCIRYVDRDRALEVAKDNGGCLVFQVALNVTPVAGVADVRRVVGAARGEYLLRYLPDELGLKDMKDDMLIAADEDGGDFQVVVVEDAEITTIGAHKVVLAARSPVMRAMLASGMTEANDGRMKIVGHSACAVQEFVRFLYSDMCQEEVLALHGWELLELADKYDVFALRRVCESWHSRQINAENAIETLQHADAHNAPTLKRKAIEYVAANKKTTIGNNNNTTLRDLGADLLSEVLRAIAD